MKKILIPLEEGLLMKLESHCLAEGKTKAGYIRSLINRDLGEVKPPGGREIKKGSPKILEEVENIGTLEPRRAFISTICPKHKVPKYSCHCL